MKPENNSKHLLKIVKSQAKMYEYNLPLKYHNIHFPASPYTLFPLTIGLLGDLCSKFNREQDVEEEINFSFPPQFFDSFINAKFDKTINDYLLLLGSASFYLADMQGSSTVLVNKISDNFSDNIEAQGLEILLKELLSGSLEFLPESEYFFNDDILSIHNQAMLFFQQGSGEEKLFKDIDILRKKAYACDNPRFLLFADIIGAIIHKKITNSAWKLLPKYSKISVERWKDALSSDTFIKELWPAQKLIGDAGCYRGISAAIQMPTSAGKTKSIEIIIRSAFLSQNIKLAIIVAPFKALCHEIKDSLSESFKDGFANVRELSDALQMDADDILDEFLGNHRLNDKHEILVLTPEKLLYVLRHTPELAKSIGLIIFDEAHQFDNGSRGITYELLLTSLKMLLPKETQKILISAVMANAKNIAEWFNGSDVVVESEQLTTMPKSFGFTDWNTSLGQIHYMNSDNIEEEDFFVPRVIEKMELKKHKGERKDRFFPVKDNAKSIALYLAIKLVKNGGVAIFCGRKDSANKLSDILVDIVDRDVSLTMPAEYSDKDEILALYNLQNANLGKESNITKSARFGIFQHHANIPHGIRIAVEYAMKKNLIKLVVCTSTLAQGVNLPIRYLIITNTRQGTGELIKTRDFHNLIGRSGRAGLHTEGSILFADLKIYNSRQTYGENWRWKETKKLIDISNSENCISSLIDFFQPIRSDNNELSLPLTKKEFKIIIDNDLKDLIKMIHKKFKKDGFDTKVEPQLKRKKELISALESFLLADKSIRASNSDLPKISPEEIAKQTLAYALADKTTKNNICIVFKIIFNHIENRSISEDKQIIYGKTLLNAEYLQSIEKYLNDNSESINHTNNTIEMLDSIWPIVSQYINTGLKDLLKPVKQWIKGASFSDIAIGLERDPDEIVDLFESKLSFESSLVFGAIMDLFDNMENINSKARELIAFLQKQIKYGLWTKSEIIIYEIGFADRVIASDLKNSLNINSTDRKFVRNRLKTADAKKVILKYPSYFHKIQNTL